MQTILKIANILFLESPANVGFSYTDNADNATGDTQVTGKPYGIC